jgi:hypothetical protein
MWEGVTYVEPSVRRVIHEGGAAANAIVMNVGPGGIRLHVWTERPQTADISATFTMFMVPGNTRSVSGDMIAVSFEKNTTEKSPHEFAAVAWRLVL